MEHLQRLRVRYGYKDTNDVSEVTGMVYEKNPPIHFLNPYERGFIEAFLDADGCIHLYKDWNKYRVRISFSNKNKRVLEKIRNILGVKRKIYENRGTGLKELRLNGRDEIYNLLDQIELVVKEYKRLVALEILNTYLCSGGKPKPILEAFKEEMNDLYHAFHREVD